MDLYTREKYLKKIRGFYRSNDIIKVITGVRRCGKSTLMKMIADELKAQGVPADRILYLDLDQRKYRKIKTADQLENLIAAGIHEEEQNYIFVDEIQNVKGFEEVINGFREDGNCSIFITGSNSYLLSGELATKLTGRYIEFEMFTLTFEEYEQMKAFYHVQISDNPMIELQNYILEGGFPRAVLIDNLEDKRRYTESVVQEIFEKDIRHRVKIRNRESFETVRQYLINNFGATTSVSNLQRDLEKNGQKITRQTLARYIQALVDAKVLYECNRFDLKSRKSIAGEKKYYLSDLSFYFALNTDNRINFGPVLENIVYFYARSMGSKVSVGRIGKLECDFIMRDAAMNYSYVQVAYTIAMSRETEEREYKPLEMIRDNYPKYVITTDYLLQKRNGIQHVNLMDFMKAEKTF
ncbi:MAG: ATP-binding protein [Lachnospiraceae bacterium]|jgi:predicted AAA+ superfamily ATPase|uniref:ATP-binding protein n=1 Tax=Anaerolactibacter massiliensis TaxID=2044573 RepID=UPI000CF98A45|nr:ATP-binding protein [Anaerolactibacter massiliensis]MCH4031639.1 ATP-binding protein [Lachnospiraceae bacterium]MCH4071122.1 ATP-binding protein [Lachnospiraceae bacterium]MCH4108193.1 ATP-binding protein [Lachnospiraceae bacterium]MCI1361403.1 ATP-binding protein [Lachnospiraceae bacterium]MCI1380694.1 ATP-binding protein [Lachnospiraceae bacterium]